MEMSHLPVQNDAPQQPESQLVVPINNVRSSDVHKVHLQKMKAWLSRPLHRSPGFGFGTFGHSEKRNCIVDNQVHLNLKNVLFVNWIKKIIRKGTTVPSLIEKVR